MAQPVTAQPAGAPKAQWMDIPQGHHSNCPPGLEYLTQVDQLLVHQQVEVFEEAFTGFETNNRYEVKNSMGQRVYFAAEDTCCCTRNCFGKERPFEIKVVDNLGKEVMQLSSPCRCDTCWCPCCLKKVEVQANGETIGFVRQRWSVCRPKFKINDANDQTVLLIDGPCFTCNICGDVEFQVFSADGSVPLGQIRKQWSGIVKEMFTDADNFGVTFPMDLDVKIKATLLGAIFLIDFMFFEKEKNEEDHKVGML